VMRILAALILMSGPTVTTFGQTPPPQGSNVCEPPEETCMGEECERSKPVIFGKPYVVPRLKIRLLDERTNKPLAGTKITLNYIWKWLEYPYTERPFGAWEEDAYSTSCYANDEGAIEVGEFKVEPRGWYKGIYSVGRAPRFLNVTAGYDLPYVGTKIKGCYTYTTFTKADLDKCKRRGRCEFTIRDACPQTGSHNLPQGSLTTH